jgi:Cu(I)/Ag(I) efflux system membrane fusion protein
MMLLTAGTLAVGFWAGSRPHPGASAPAQTAAPVESARKPLYYGNPMGLPDTSPVPKKDAMGMDYVPVYAGNEVEDPGVVKVSPERVQTLGVKTALAEERTLEAGVRAVGRVEINERAIYDVAPRFDGWIERLYVNATGDPVRKGQPLFSVYSPELVSAYKELGIARELQQRTQEGDPGARERAERLAGASQERLRNWGISPDARKTDASHVLFSSPANGIVLDKPAVAGMRFMAGTAIYRIVDLSTVWVIADVYEQDLDRVKVGQTATIGIDAFPDHHFSAKVSYLYPTLNAATRTTQVRLALPNRDGQLRPGMFAHVEIATGGAHPRLTVPSSAIIDNGSRQVVLLALDRGRFKPQAVKIGLRSGDFVEILDGLKSGDRVVVAASFLIDAESNLKAALANFASPTASAKKANTYQAAGSLDAIAGKEVTISHEPIPALKWPGMTMDFQLASPDLVRGIAPGAPIRFEFEQRGPGEFVITRIETTGAATPKSNGAP